MAGLLWHGCDLASAFPIPDHPSLAGCKLREQSSAEDRVVYVLVCEKDAATTGTATWQLGEHVIRGTLDVKPGGKYRRIENILIRSLQLNSGFPLVMSQSERAA